MIDTAGASPQANPSRGSEPTGGLAGTTAVIFLAVVTLVAAVLSAATGRGFGTFFNVVYVIATIYIALRIHVEDRFTAVIAPPIVYALSVFLAGFFDSEESSHALRRVIENTFLNVSLGAPWLVLATVASIVIVFLRGRRAAVASRRR